MERLKYECSLLKLMANTNDIDFLQSVIMRCSKNTIFAICEISKNILAGNLHISRKEKSQLLRYKNVLRNLSLRTKNVTVIYRRKLLIKNIGVIPFIILPFLKELHRIKEGHELR
jgi:hypothetical protein